MEEQKYQSGHEEEPEAKDRGLLDLMRKKEEKGLVTGMEKLHVEEVEKKEDENPSLLETLHQSHSSSSASNEEEGEKKNAPEAAVVTDGEDTFVEVERVDDVVDAGELEKKGLFEKIKEKLPGHDKKPNEEAAAPAIECSDHAKDHATDGHGQDGKEKKGILGKIMEKLPGYTKNGGDEKETEKTGA
ncbi:uncharacterized protein [Typha latifolia]|uniref:uncharacterized protein n=1 Tax=Typha latifolia TaxID=4733 RepID=UPI003C2CE7CC